MELSKNTYRKTFESFQITEQELSKLKSLLLSILVDFKISCEKHGLKYSLGGGTLLGAIRHGGFIPWDDDIDIVMERKFYDQLPKVIEAEFGDKYFFAGPGFSKYDSIKFLKIMKKGTKLIEIETEGLSEIRGIGIDIFPIENTPDNSVIRGLKGRLYNLFSKAPSLCMDFKFPSKPILDSSKSSKKIKAYYNTRRSLGFFCSILTIKKWTSLLDSFAQNKNSHSKLMCIPTGRKGYLGEVFERSVFEHLIDINFEGISFKSLVNFDVYLKNLYSDYLILPPVEKREKHNIFNLDFGD